MQLEAGKKYTDRRGRVYGPMVQVHDGCYGLFGENRDDYGWYRDGRRSPGRDIQGDLVAEYVEPPLGMALEKPAEYRALNEGETIQPGDEYCGYSGKWEKVPSSGNVFQTSLYRPHRRLVEPAAPVESPDDWVILDLNQYADHELRKGVDWYFAIDKWHVINGYDGVTIADFKISDSDKVRCLRKDLPPVPPKTRTVEIPVT